jgi:hypothetical protein
LSHILDVGTKPDIELPYCQRSTCILDQTISFKEDSIYRAREPNWLGKYQNSKEKFADYNTETKMLKGAEKQPANKGKVVFSYSTAFELLD